MLAEEEPSGPPASSLRSPNAHAERARSSLLINLLDRDHMSTPTKLLVDFRLQIDQNEGAEESRHFLPDGTNFLVQEAGIRLHPSIAGTCELDAAIFAGATDFGDCLTVKKGLPLELNRSIWQSLDLQSLL